MYHLIIETVAVEVTSLSSSRYLLSTNSLVIWKRLNLRLFASLRPTTKF